MKKQFYLLCGLLLSSIATFAQITITQSDFGKPGDSVYYGIDTTFFNTVSIGPAGTNQNWDFSTGISTDDHDLLTIHDSSFDSNAPVGTNIITNSKYEGIQYFHIDSLVAKIIVEDPISGSGTLGFRIADFPMAYGKQFTDSAKIDFKTTGAILGFPQIDSVWIKVNVTNKVKCDGWGSLTIKSGVYDVLRVKNTNTQDILVLGKGLITLNQWIQLEQQTENLNYFSFLGKNSKYFIAQATTDSLDNLTLFTWQESKGSSTGLYSQEADLMDIQIYPNPATNELKVQVNSKVEGDIKAELMDITGKVVLASEKSLNNEVYFNTSSLENGIYFCRINNNHISVTQKVFISK